MSQFLAFQQLVEEECFKSRKVQYYAQKLGVSSRTLNNIVNEVIHDSAKAFIDERTIMQMKRLLISTNHSIKEVAYMAGFSDPTNFLYNILRSLREAPPKHFGRHISQFSHFDSPLIHSHHYWYSLHL